MQGRKKTQKNEIKAGGKKKKKFWKKETTWYQRKREPPLENRTNKKGRQKIKQDMKDNSKGKRKKCRGEKSTHSSEE